ncbi:MAG: SpoIID/LytB domain-containing protein [Firmicutes bacterium]|nr:SpoIID/LytB domain-containing protein [Bacillota bacterium]
MEMRREHLALFCLFVLTAICIFANPDRAAAAEAPLIRVALDEGVPAAVFNVVQGGYALVDGASGISLGAPAPGETWSVTASGTALLVQGGGLTRAEPFQGPLLLQAKEKEQLNLFAYKGVQYRGDLVVQNLGGRLLVVNLIDLERYLYGVVGREMGGGAAPEAYCAQAVVSRSYALAMKGLNPWYDVGKDAATQVYGGYTGEAAYAVNGKNPVVEAVERTRGEVLEYLGTLVRAFFHANAGGHTEDSENVWLEALPYLRGVPSPADAYAETYGSWAAGTYRWTKTVERKDLEAKLGIGRIREIRVSRCRTTVTRDPVTGKLRREFLPGTRTVSGRVTEVTIIGSEGVKSFYRDGIRAPFGLKSTLFDLSFEGGLRVLNAQGEVQALAEPGVWILRKGDRLVSFQDRGDFCVIGRGGRLNSSGSSFERLVFAGRGYGHGVGLSQWGARGLAVQGYTYREILELYYNQGKNNGNLQIVGNYGF